MWGVKPPPEVADETCQHCQEIIMWRWESEDQGQWMHRKGRSIRCELFAIPKMRSK